MARVAVGNRRIAGMGKAFLLGPAIGRRYALRGGRICHSIMKRVCGMVLPRLD